MPLVVVIKVVPSSGRSEWALDRSWNLKCYLKSPPEKGKANQELIKSLAKVLNLTQSNVVIIAGATGRTKTVKIDLRCTLPELLVKLGLKQGAQRAIF
jgi:hypothetical protein